MIFSASRTNREPNKQIGFPSRYIQYFDTLDSIKIDGDVSVQTSTVPEHNNTLASSISVETISQTVINSVLQKFHNSNIFGSHQENYSTSINLASPLAEQGKASSNKPDILDKYILVFSGAGIRYPIFLGIYDALRQSKLANAPSAIFGTSGGAIAGLYIKIYEELLAPLIDLLEQLKASNNIPRNLDKQHKKIFKFTEFEQQQLGHNKLGSSILLMSWLFDYDRLIYPHPKSRNVIARLTNKLKQVLNLLKYYGVYLWRADILLLEVIKIYLKLNYFVICLLQKECPKSKREQLLKSINLLDKTQHHILRKFQLPRLKQPLTKANAYMAEYSSKLNKYLYKEIPHLFINDFIHLTKTDIITHSIDESIQKHDMIVKHFASATNINLKHFELLNSEDEYLYWTVSYALASASAPVYFSPTFTYSPSKKQLFWYVDGGLSKQLPIDEAVDYARANSIPVVIVVNMSNTRAATEKMDTSILGQSKGLSYLIEKGYLLPPDETREQIKGFLHYAGKLIETVLRTNTIEAIDDIISYYTDKQEDQNNTRASHYEEDLIEHLFNREQYYYKLNFDANLTLVKLGQIEVGNSRAVLLVARNQESKQLLKIIFVDVAAADISSMLYIDEFIQDFQYRYSLYQYGYTIGEHVAKLFDLNGFKRAERSSLSS